MQLGTFNDSTEAEYYWMFLIEDHGEYLDSYSYNIDTASHGEFGNNARELKLGPVQTSGMARQICETLRMRKVSCVVSR